MHLRKFLILITVLSFTVQSQAESLTDNLVERTRPKINEKSEEDGLQRRPLFELGVASINSWTPDYPGASQGQFRPIVVPTIVYRGDFFRSDSDGTRARLLTNKDFEFSMSFGGNFPVRSKDNTARRGMDTLGQIIQVGPRLMYFLKNDKDTKIYFDIAARTGFAIGSSWRAWRGVGLTGDIGINYRQRWDSHELFLLLYTSVASYELNKYFYDVKQKDVTQTREAYHSRSGYIGTNFLIGYAKDFSKEFSIFLGAGVAFLDGHVNSKSPLFKENLNGKGVIGLKYTLVYSDEKVSE